MGLSGWARSVREWPGSRKGLNMNVIGYDPLINPDHYDRLGVKPVSLTGTPVLLGCGDPACPLDP